MRRIKYLVPALLACMVLTGCGNQTKETEAPTEAQTEAQTEVQTETETETEPQTETETEAEDSMNRTRTLKGLVKSSDSTTLTIQTERGKELEFSLTGADIQVTGGIAEGSNVNILYKGEIEGTDTTNAKVLMVKDLDAGETAVTEGELMTEAEEADPEAGAGTLEGTIYDVSIDRIVILANDGESYYFSMNGTEMNLKNGTQIGNYVTVQYDGDIYGPDLVAATSITDAQTDADKVAYGGSDGEGYNYISGTLIDCTADTVTIQTDDGDELAFDTSKARQVYQYGMTYGNYIIIEYTGDDTASAEVTAVYDYSEDTASGSTEETAAEDTAAEDAGAEAVTVDDGTTDAA